MTSELPRKAELLLDRHQVNALPRPDDLWAALRLFHTA